MKESANDKLVPDRASPPIETDLDPNPPDSALVVVVVVVVVVVAMPV